MLKVKSRSRMNGASGSTIIARIMTTTSGAISARIAFAFGPSQACSCCTRAFMLPPARSVRRGRAGLGVELGGNLDRRQRERHRHLAAQRRAQLVDVREHLGDGGEERRRDLAVELG